MITVSSPLSNFYIYCLSHSSSSCNWNRICF